MSRALDVDEMANEREEGQEEEEEEPDQQMPKLFAAPAIIADCELWKLRERGISRVEIARDLPIEPFALGGEKVQERTAACESKGERGNT